MLKKKKGIGNNDIKVKTEDQNLATALPQVHFNSLVWSLRLQLAVKLLSFISSSCKV